MARVPAGVGMEYAALLKKLKPNTCPFSTGFFQLGFGSPSFVGNGEYGRNRDLVSDRSYVGRSFVAGGRSGKDIGFCSNDFLNAHSKTQKPDLGCLKLKLLEELTGYHTRISHAPPGYLGQTMAGGMRGKNACSWIAPSPSKLLSWPETAGRRWKALNVPKDLMSWLSYLGIPMEGYAYVGVVRAC